MDKYLSIAVTLIISFNLYADDVVRLGVTVPLSGDYSASGNYIKLGVEQAVADLAEENKHVQVYYEDACLPTVAISSLQRLILHNKIDAIASNFCVIALPAIKSLVIEHNLPVMQTSVVPETLAKENKNVYSTYPLVRHEIKRIADYLYKERGLKTTAILYLETPWGLEYAKLFEQYYLSLGGKITHKVSNPISDNDFKSTLNKIRQQKPETLFLVHFGSSLDILLKQIKAYRLDSRLVGVQDAYDLTLTKNSAMLYPEFEFFMPDQNLEINSNLSHPLSIRSYFDTKQLVNAIISCDYDRICTNSKLNDQFSNYANQVPSFVRYSIW